MSKIKLKPLVVSILISLGVGLLSSAFVMGSSQHYEMVAKPPLAPPSYIFPIVWTILFILMGISAYRIYISEDEQKTKALTIYAAQLIVNFFWPLLFFRLELYLASFLWLVILWIMILRMMSAFKRIDLTACRLQIPYLIWVTFAGYLNFGVFWLNR